MSVEIIEAIGQYVVFPICLFGYLAWLTRSWK